MSEGTANESEPPVVLIVEDEMILRCNLAECLREAGCVVVEAASAGHAMAVCHDEMPVHVLITDIQLNDTATGWDVAKAFRALWNNIQVIYTSGNANDPTRSVPNSLFFHKPYRADEVLSACQQLMASNRPA